MGVVCMLQISGMQAAGLMTPGLRLNDQQIEDLRRTLEPLNEALEVLVEPDHAWAASYLPDVLIYQKAVASALCLLYTSPSPRDATLSRMPSSA